MFTDREHSAPDERPTNEARHSHSTLKRPAQAHPEQARARLPLELRQELSGVVGLYQLLWDELPQVTLVASLGSSGPNGRQSGILLDTEADRK